MPKRIAVIQSNYIPWKGYFDIINMVDEFIIYDECQYTRRDWRNRNIIKTKDGLRWLTIPVKVKGKFHQKIKDVQIADVNWPKKHWRIISENYKNSNYFDQFKEIFENIYSKMNKIYLSEINYIFIFEICKILGIKTEIKWSQEISSNGNRSERLSEICRMTGADEYFSGPSARTYLDETRFKEFGCDVKWIDYSGYPRYRQLFGRFFHEVSILDLLFNEGKMATKYMKSFDLCG